MQYKYTENSACGKWFTHFKSFFIFEGQVGRNISLVQPTPLPVVIRSKIKNNNKNNNKVTHLMSKEQD